MPYKRPSSFLPVRKPGVITAKLTNREKSADSVTRKSATSNKANQRQRTNSSFRKQDANSLNDDLYRVSLENAFPNNSHAQMTNTQTPDFDVTATKLMDSYNQQPDRSNFLMQSCISNSKDTQNHLRMSEKVHSRRMGSSLGIQ